MGTDSGHVVGARGGPADPLLCEVRPGHLGLIGATLDKLFATALVAGLDEWREAFEAAVKSAASIVLDHTRPRFAQVGFATDEAGVTVVILESGRWWLGTPPPEHVLDDLAAASPVLDSVTYQRAHLGHEWTLRKRALISRAEVPPSTVLAGVARDVLETLVDQAPVGIATIRPDGRYIQVNRAYATMFGYATPEEVLGRTAMDDLDPEVLARERAHFLAIWEGRQAQLRVDNRKVYRDGRVAWHSTIAAPLRGPEGRPEAVMMFVQDTTELTQQKEHAARIQRDLLPSSAPRIEGYDLAGGCLPAQDMAGDFFDWVLRDDGQLDLTVADVMGKGMAAALVMAALRTGLRAVGPEAGPAERVRIAASSLGLATDGGLFVTLFQARLDLATGVLRYVDAGHGYWAIRRANGRLVQPRKASLPLLVLSEEGLREGEASLAPGETLVLYSDGLVEVDDRTLDVGSFEKELGEAEDSEAVVQRLLGTVPAYLSDDVTVLVLRRLAEVTSGSRLTKK